jgi:hypothetical protein
LLQEVTVGCENGILSLPLTRAQDSHEGPHFVVVFGPPPPQVVGLYGGV